MIRRRGGTPEQARLYRQRGHDDALLFALLLGLTEDYQRDRQAKKDVIDPAGDAHSVKSGEKKWQIFLYRRSRFENDLGFAALNGIGAILMRCIDSFPAAYEDYIQDKVYFKRQLRIHMQDLRNRLQDTTLLQAFLMKSIFNGGEVNYLTICDDDQFHVYWNREVVRVMGENFVVENSTSRRGSPDCQKVLLKYHGKNVGEIEMRNDSRQHYREIRFLMMKRRCCELLQNHILGEQHYADIPIVSHGEAMSNFWNW